MVRVDHVLHRLVGDFLQLRHDAVVVHLELVIDEHHALVRDHRRDVAGHEVVVDGVQIVGNLHGVQLGRLRRPADALAVSRPRTPAQDQQNRDTKP